LVYLSFLNLHVLLVKVLQRKRTRMYVCMCVYTHTHTHTHIYICRERDREREGEGGKEGDIYFKESAYAIVEAWQAQNL